MFSVTCLGRNGLYPTDGEPTSGYLIKCDGVKILVDLGSGVFAALFKVVEPSDLDAVILSHLHGDHSSDLSVFDYYLNGKGKKISLFCPKFESGYLSTYNFSPEFLCDGKTINVKGVKIEFFRTVHPVECYGVIVNYDGKKLVYSADTNVCEALDTALNGSDLAVLDCAFSKEKYLSNGPHLSSVLCGGYSLKHNVKTLLSHLPPKGDLALIEAEAKSVSPLCEIIKHATYSI